MRVFFLITLLGALAVGLMAAPPEHLNFGKKLNASQCDPSAGKLVLNVVFQVANDADSGFGGYWALDSYNKTVKVYQVGETAFCAIVKYQGSFVTSAGTSPSGVGTVGAGVKGTMEGGYQGVITGTLNPAPALDMHGNIGTYDYACSTADPDSTCNYFSWISAYFNPGASFTYDWWGWIYHGGNNGTWVNAVDALPAVSGDITGQAKKK